MTPRRRGLATLAVLVLVAGCTGDRPDVLSPAGGIDVDTAELRTAKARIGVAPCPSTEAPASELPPLSLPCLGGGPAVDLSTISGPAVLPVWAQWCGPCRDELPLFQRLAEEGRVTVMGVDWNDAQPGLALELLDVTGARFPQLADPDRALDDHYRLNGLPAVLLVDDQGRVTFLKRRVADYDELLGLVEEHTGVRVTRS